MIDQHVTRNFSIKSKASGELVETQSCIVNLRTKIAHVRYSPQGHVASVKLSRKWVIAGNWTGKVSVLIDNRAVKCVIEYSDERGL